MISAAFQQDIRSGIGVGTLGELNPISPEDCEFLHELAPVMREPDVLGRGYEYVRPSNNQDWQRYWGVGEKLVTVLSTSLLIEKFDEPPHEGYIIRYIAGSGLLPHVDTDYPDSPLIRMTYVFRGEGSLWSMRTGDTELSLGQLMVQDLTKPVLHSVSARTERAVAVWDIPGRILPASAATAASSTAREAASSAKTT